MKLLCYILVICTVESVAFDGEGMESDGAVSMSVPVGQVKLTSVPPFGHVVISTLDIPAAASYVLCQVHTHAHNLTLAFSPSTPTPDRAVTGRDIGLLTLLGAGQTNTVAHLLSSHNLTTNALVSVTALTASDPLPGGCNVEFNLQYDPNIHLQYTSQRAILDYGWANIGFRRTTSIQPDCESMSAGSLQYELYVYYIREHDFTESQYFHAMKKMLKADDVIKHGVKVTDMQTGATQKSKWKVSSYQTQGVIYSIVVRNTSLASMAAYVPIATYACDIHNLESSCKVLDIEGIVLATIGGIVGMFLCFLGHRYFKTEMFIFGFLAFALVFYIIFGSSTDLSHIVTLVLAVLFGVGGGILWLGMWWNCGVPVLAVLFNALVAGFLFSSTLFYTPFGNISWWQGKFNYGMTFTCGVLIVPVFMLCFTRALNVVACAFLGSYALVLAVDMYLHSGMKYILINSLRRAMVPRYVEDTIVTGPFSTNEIILTLVWLGLFVGGVTFQLIRERKKALFPPCPRTEKERQRLIDAFIRDRGGVSGDSERAPLLGGDRRAGYGGPQSINNPVVTRPIGHPGQRAASAELTQPVTGTSPGSVGT